jgi:hypothetical protein
MGYASASPYIWHDRSGLIDEKRPGTPRKNRNFRLSGARG